jgi:imidazole glycerol-phosphate synthase subunit HisH
MSILIVDYGMGNLGSLTRAIEENGGEPFITSRPEDLENVNKVILPGVGAFKSGMENLASGEWVRKLKQQVLEDKIVLLGICLGMQLLAERSYEHGVTEGLGLIPGEVKKIIPNKDFERIPHVGWNEVKMVNRGHWLFEGISDETDFYFVHSYYFDPVSTKNAITSTDYCGQFTSSVCNDTGNVYGVQFHPEKSSKSGFKLLKNFIEY